MSKGCASKHQIFRHRPCKPVDIVSPAIRNLHKPDWVIPEVLRLKALMGKQVGCRKIAATFNRLHGLRCTVGKTFVAETIKTHQYQLACITRKIHRKPPYVFAVNKVWAMDLTFYTDDANTTHTILGIIDHGSRLMTRLQVVVNKKAWILLGHLCLAIGQHGKPQAIRTDNERIFTSFVFRTFLTLAGIKQQQTQVCAPWQNGRVERFFGTLKSLLRQLIIPNANTLADALSEIAFFYNHVQPHQNLGGLTPAEAWNGLTLAEIIQRKNNANLISALGGLLVGFHHRR